MSKKKIVLIFIIIALFSFWYSQRNKEVLLIAEELEQTADEEQEETVPEEEKMIYVHIAGRVQSPGVYQIAEGTRLDELLKLAVPEDMELVDRLFNRAELLKDGQKRYIPAEEEIQRAEINISEADDSSKVDINHADCAELMKLPGIGEKKAGEIINFREKNGNFKKIDDIINVTGIGNATFEKIKELITI